MHPQKHTESIFRIIPPGQLQHSALNVMVAMQLRRLRWWNTKRKDGMMMHDVAVSVAEATSRWHSTTFHVRQQSNPQYRAPFAYK